LAQYDINLREYWRVLKKRQFIIIVTAIILGVFSFAVAIIKAPIPLYASVCSIKFQRDIVEGLYTKTLSWSGGDDIQTQIAIIKGFELFKRVAVKMTIVSAADIESNQIKPATAGLIEGLQGKVVVKREGFTNIINIEAQDANAGLAKKLAETVARTYQEVHGEEQAQRTIEAIKYITEQKEEKEKGLKKAEDEFNDFSRINQIVSIQAQSENLLNDAQQIQNDIRKIVGERQELEDILTRLEKFPAHPFEGATNFYSAKSSPEYQQANNSLLELLVQRNTLLQDYTPKHPDLVANTRKIIETANKMIMLMRLQIDSLNKKESDLKLELADNEGKTRSLMDKKVEYERRKRNVDLYSDMVTLLERKNQEALIQKAENDKAPEVTIVREALESDTPVNPPRTVFTGFLGIIIGLVLGMVAAFIAETFDTSLGAIEDVEESIGAPVLGVVPETDPEEVREELWSKYPEPIKSSPFLQSIQLVTHFSPKSMMAESFRALRTNIQFKDTEKKIKTIAITSASPQEGKTVISINLAITMAQAGLKTLLIGSDMRKPMLAKIFGVEETPGLTDILLGNYPWRDTVKSITDIIMGKMTLEEIMLTPGLDNLHVITGGTIPPNPAELIESKHLTEFIAEAQNEYDLILFDSPPIVSTADAIILGAKVDGVLLVYRLGTVSKGLLKRASSQLAQVNCNILGVVLNGMKPEFSPDFQDAKYYKYYYSYGEEDKDHRLKGGQKAVTFSQKHLKSFLKSKVLVALLAKFKQKLWIWVLIAVICLAVGILWQNGIFNLFKFLGLSK
jgi:capsular exopolysaccharide synthesis family protein